MKGFKKEIIGMLMVTFISLFVWNVDVQAAEAKVTATTGVAKTSVCQGGEVGVTVNVVGTTADAGVTKVVDTDVVLVMDCSGSMSGSVSSLKQASKDFVDTLDLSVHRVGVVMYGLSSTENIKSYDFSQDSTTIKATLDGLTAEGNTPTGDGIQAAINMLQGSSATAKTIILMTDGMANVGNGSLSGEAYGVQMAESAKAAGYICYTVGINAGTKSEVLKSMATSADHHYAPSASELPSVYRTIGSNIGVVGSYDVTISQTVSDSFTIVEDSVSGNIPVPTIAGNTITWHMNEVHAQKISFTYAMRAKDDAALGRVKQTSAGTVVYHDIDGNEYREDIVPSIIRIVETQAEEDEELEIPVLESLMYYSTNTRQVKIKGSDMTNVAEIDLNGTRVAVEKATANYLWFYVPEDVQGPITITGYMADGTQAEGSISLSETEAVEPVETPTLVTLMSHSKTTKLTKIKGTKLKSITEVDINGTRVAPSNVTANYLYFYVPASLSGTLTINAYTADGTKANGEIVLSAAAQTVATPILQTLVSYSASLRRVKIKGKNLKGVAEVEIAGQRIAKLDISTANYLYFIVPADIGGTNEVTAYTKDGIEASGSVMVTTTSTTAAEAVTAGEIQSVGTYSTSTRLTKIKGTELSNISYVEANGQKVDLKSASANYIYFYMPTTLSGDVEVKAYTKDGTAAKGSVTVQVK